MGFPLLSLLLLAGQTPAADAPMATAAPVKAEAAAADAMAEYTPAGAPKGDYAFVAWCKGVLTGHMDLAERVKDVLPLDDVQQKVGKAYLRAYDVALTKGKAAQSPETLAEADAARQTGWMNWEPTRKADKQLAADSYLAWQLPGRCEHAAVRVAGDKALFRLAPDVDEVASMGVDAPMSSRGNAAPPPAAEAPKAAPAPVQATAPSEAAAEAAPAVATSEPAKEEAAPAVAETTDTAKADAVPAQAAPDAGAVPAVATSEPIKEEPAPAMATNAEAAAEAKPAVVASADQPNDKPTPIWKTVAHWFRRK
jgi:hypothetical protein